MLLCQHCMTHTMPWLSVYITLLPKVLCQVGITNHSDKHVRKLCHIHLEWEYPPSIQNPVNFSTKQSQPLVVYIVLMFYAMFYATNIIIGHHVTSQQFYLRHPFPLPLKNLNIYFQLFTISLSHSIMWFQCSLILFFFVHQLTCR